VIQECVKTVIQKTLSKTELQKPENSSISVRAAINDF
jgi:hypothetical protein